MKAVMCEEFAAPEHLKLRDLEEPQPHAGGLRIRVEACGVNFPETLIIQNKYQFKPELPFTPGGEVAGVVDAIGEGVSGFEIGDKVMAMALTGGYAEQIVVDAAAVRKRPETMSGETAAGFTMTYGTSMHALKQRARLQPGETLLVLGAGGGVGLAAVEIGKAMGARVIAAASSEDKLRAAQRAGADALIDYTTEDLRARLKELTGGRGVDAFYDPVGGEMFETCLRSLAWGGRALVIGFASGEIPKVAVNLPLLKGCDIVGVFWGAFRRQFPQEDARNFDELFAWYEAGRLSPQISRVYPLEQAGQALIDLTERKVVGKVIVKP
ncbi:NADPH:quinone oxidoreductase family protein [Shimia sp.]|uniref:NADPH:quinone oxidoreductase family protein n=1 Tax=Shimia sp. TaxID=1954381 RepID=UPI0035683D35